MDKIIPFYAIDMESEYGDSVSVKTLGAFNYARATDIFLVGIYGPGVEYVGPLESAPWDKISGKHWVSHNASFDETLFRVAQSKGQIPQRIEPILWSCSADLSAYCLLGRSLKDAAKHGLSLEMSKVLRQRIKNKRFSDLKPAFREDFKRYCLDDARNCWLLWEKYSPQWPEEEQEFAQIIRKRCREGVRIDLAKLLSQKSVLWKLCREAALALPWGEPYLAVAQVRAYCEGLGIKPPTSLAEDSPEAAEWEARYGKEYPIVSRIRDYRKANILLRKVEAMERRIMPDGRMYFDLLYHGAGATGRLAGSNGLNIQNLNREPYQGVDLRRLLIAKEGMKFLIADFAQIEPRVIAWITGNRKLLDRLQEGVSFYEEDARQAGTWDGAPGTFKKSDPARYRTQKAQTLGIGYGTGPPKFCKVAFDELGIEMNLTEAARIIHKWKARNPGVMRLWNRLERDFKLSHWKKEPYILVLPSGRSLTYMDIATKPDPHGLKYTAKNKHGSQWKSYWGGSLFENLIQATARDILRDAVLACERAGIAVRFTAHDELVCEVPDNFDSSELAVIMRTTPQWAEGLPLDCEIIESNEYLK